MRPMPEILRYARECPAGDPVPITKSEIPEIVGWARALSLKKSSNEMTRYLTESMEGRRFTILGHTVIVL